MDQKELTRVMYELFRQRQYAELIEVLFAHAPRLQYAYGNEKEVRTDSLLKKQRQKEIANLKEVVKRRLQALGLIPCNDQESIQKILQGLIYSLTITPANTEGRQIVYATRA